MFVLDNGVGENCESRETEPGVGRKVEEGGVGSLEAEASKAEACCERRKGEFEIH